MRKWAPFVLVGGAAIAAIAIFASLSNNRQGASNENRIGVTIKPLHALVSSIAADHHDILLIYEDRVSPHGFSLSPQARRIVETAPIIFGIHPQFEVAIGELAQQENFYTLLDEYEPHQDHHEGEAQAEVHDHHEDEGEEEIQAGTRSQFVDLVALEPHPWLNPPTMIEWAGDVAEILSDQFPDNAQTYKQRAADYQRSIERKFLELQNNLLFVREVPFIVLHAGFEDFSRAAEINQISLNAVEGYASHDPMTPRSIVQIRDIVKDNNVTCAFYTNDMSHSDVESIIGDNSIKLKEIDFLGETVSSEELSENGDLYLALLDKIETSLLECLHGEEEAS